MRRAVERPHVGIRRHEPSIRAARLAAAAADLAGSDARQRVGGINHLPAAQHIGNGRQEVPQPPQKPCCRLADLDLARSPKPMQFGHHFLVAGIAVGIGVFRLDTRPDVLVALGLAHQSFPFRIGKEAIAAPPQAPVAQRMDDLVTGHAQRIARLRRNRDPAGPVAPGHQRPGFPDQPVHQPRRHAPGDAHLCQFGVDLARGRGDGVACEEPAFLDGVVLFFGGDDIGIHGRQNGIDRFGLVDRKEEPFLPRNPLDDDAGIAQQVLLLAAHEGGAARQLDFRPPLVRYGHGLDAPAVRQFHRLVLGDLRQDSGAAHLRRSRLGVEIVQRFGEILRRDGAAKEAPPIIQGNPRHVDLWRCETVPDWQDAADDEVKVVVEVGRALCVFLFPEFARLGLVNALEIVDMDLAVTHIGRAAGPDDGIGAFDLPLVIGRCHAGGDDCRHPTGLLVAEIARAAGCIVHPALGQRIEIVELVRRLVFDVEVAHRGIGGLVAEHFLLGQNLRADMADGFQAVIEGAETPGNLDLRIHRLQEDVEHNLLGIEAQRQEAVEELRCRRDVVLVQATGLVDDPGKSHLGQKIIWNLGRSRGAGDGFEEHAHRRTGVFGLQVVGGREDRPPGRVALACRQRPKLLKATGDRGNEPLVRRDVGCHQPVDGRVGLIGAVRAAKPLHRLVGAPPGLNDIMGPLALVLVAQIGMERKSGAASLREHQNPALVILERLRIGLHGCIATLLDLALAVLVENQALLAASDLGDLLGSEPVYKHLQRGIGYPHGADGILQLLSPRLCLLVDNRAAFGIVNDADKLVPIQVGIGFVLIDRERLVDELDQHFARRQVHFFQIAAVLVAAPGLCLGDGAFLIGLVGIGDLQDDGAALGKISVDLIENGRHLRGGDDLVEEALMRAPELRHDR